MSRIALGPPGLTSPMCSVHGLGHARFAPTPSPADLTPPDSTTPVPQSIEDAIVVLIEKAIVDMLNSTDFILPITADRAYELTRDTRFTGIRITVLPGTLILSSPDLSPRKFFDWQVAAWIQSVVPLTNDAIDPLMLLQQQIALKFIYKPLESTPSRCIAIEASQPVDWAMLSKNGVFRSELLMTFRWPKL